MSDESKPKVKKVKFSAKAKGVFISVEGEPELVKAALKEALALITGEHAG